MSMPRIQILAVSILVLSLSSSAASQQLKIDVRRPIVNPGGPVIACSADFAAALRQIAESETLQNDVELNFQVLSWDSRCETSDFEFESSNHALVKISLRTVHHSESLAGLKYLFLGTDSPEARIICKRLKTHTTAACVLIEDLSDGSNPLHK